MVNKLGCRVLVKIFIQECLATSLKGWKSESELSYSIISNSYVLKNSHFKISSCEMFGFDWR